MSSGRKLASPYRPSTSIVTERAQRYPVGQWPATAGPESITPAGSSTRQIRNRRGESRHFLLGVPPANRGSSRNRAGRKLNVADGVTPLVKLGGHVLRGHSRDDEVDQSRHGLAGREDLDPIDARQPVPELGPKPGNAVVRPGETDLFTQPAQRSLLSRYCRAVELADLVSHRALGGDE